MRHAPQARKVKCNLVDYLARSKIELTEKTGRSEDNQPLAIRGKSQCQATARRLETKSCLVLVDFPDLEALEHSLVPNGKGAAVWSPNDVRPPARSGQARKFLTRRRAPADSPQTHRSLLMNDGDQPQSWIDVVARSAPSLLVWNIHPFRAGPKVRQGQRGNS